MKMMKIKPFKIRNLTEEQSRIVQETLFENGFEWICSKREFCHYKEFYIGNNKNIQATSYFSSKEQPELTFEEFQQKYCSFEEITKKEVVKSCENCRFVSGCNCTENYGTICYQTNNSKWQPKEEEFVLPEQWYCVTTEDNKEVLSEWRFGRLDYILPSNKAVGMCKWLEKDKISKEHNDKTVVDTDNFSFGREITFDQFKKYVIKQDEVRTDISITGQIWSNNTQSNHLGPLFGETETHKGDLFKKKVPELYVTPIPIKEVEKSVLLEKVNIKKVKY